MAQSSLHSHARTLTYCPGSTGSDLQEEELAKKKARLLPAANGHEDTEHLPANVARPHDLIGRSVVSRHQQMTIVALDTNDNGLAGTSGAPCQDAANEDRLRVDFARANPFARKQINRDIHQVTHDRGACQKACVKFPTVIYFLLLVATKHIGKN